MSLRNQFILTLTALLLLLCCSPAFAQDLKRQGSFGVQLAPVPEATRAQLHLAEGRGILVPRVGPGSSAADAGIVADDIILKINETEVGDVGQFVELARGFRAGDSVRVTLLRGGRQVNKSFALKPRPMETSPDFDILYKSVVADGTRRRVISANTHLTRACARPPTRRLSNSLNRSGQRVMPGVRSLARIGNNYREEDSL